MKRSNDYFGLFNNSINFNTTLVETWWDYQDIENHKKKTSYDIVETTSFGDTAKKRIAGLADNSVSFEWNQDFAASALEATIYPLLGTAVTVVVKPVATTVGPTNPSYSFSALISEWQPLSGGIGELASVSTTFPISGAITKATS